MKKVEICERHLLDLIHYARRYCDARATYSSHDFNKIYIEIRSDYPDTMRKDQFDNTLKDKGSYWPYAQDGMYNSNNKSYNAIPNEGIL